MNRHAVTPGIAVALSVLALLSAAACSPLTPPTTTPGRMMQGTPSNAGTGTGQPGSTDGAGGSSSAGQRIWLTGVGADGQSIVRSAPQVSQGALMMGGGGCASCHGAGGRGGTLRMMMGPAIKAPDVTYAALIKAGFTDATIGRAITQGLDEQGKPLDAAMPRWQMSTADVGATVAYLKVLGSQ